MSVLAGIGAALGIGSLVSGAAGQILNYKAQSDNLDYQKDLQKQLFEREDTALQRRMEDAKNAGLNPYSVAGGSGASAGSVVSTTAPKVDTSTNFGAIIDVLRSVEGLKQDKINTAIMSDQAVMLNNSAQLSQVATDYKLGRYSSDYLNSAPPFLKNLRIIYGSDFLNFAGALQSLNSRGLDLQGKSIDNLTKGFRASADYQNLKLAQDSYDYNLKYSQYRSLMAEHDYNWRNYDKLYPMFNGVLQTGSKLIPRF